jgi:hypothetical protein
MRVVPVGDDWLLAGSLLSVPAEAGDVLLKAAAADARTHAEGECRNPAHRERARERQRRERELFVEHFGSDYVVVPGAELPDRLDGLRSRLGLDEPDWPTDLLAAERVGVAHGPAGLAFHQHAGAPPVGEPDGDRLWISVVPDRLRPYLEPDTGWALRARA